MEKWNYDLWSALIFNLDAGQPEVVQRGSPWYEKKSFSSLVQNILIMQILTSNLVSVHTLCIPTHTSVLAYRSSLCSLRYPLLVASIWDASRNPLLANLSSPLFNCTYLLAACSLVITALLVTRHKAYGTSSFSLINVRCRWYPVGHCVLYIYLLASCSRWRY